MFCTQTPLPHDPMEWGQNSTFSEHGHVAYQIKGKLGCKYLARRPPPPPDTRSQKVKTFSEHCHVAKQIKGNGA